MPIRIAAVAVAAVAVAGGIGTIVAMSSGGASDGPARSASLPQHGCVHVVPSRLPADAPRMVSGRAFTRFLDTPLHALPGARLSLNGKPLYPAATEFERGTLAGFIADLALHGKYRSENNQLVRSLHYPVRKWPLLPLEGSIVSQVPGPLEVYASSYIWRDAAGIRNYLHIFRKTLGQPGYRVSSRPLHPGHGSFGYRWTPVSMRGPFKSQRAYETVAGVVIVSHRKAIWIVVQGGSATSIADAVRLEKMTEASCG